MKTTSVLPPKHDHDFHIDNTKGERRTRLVVAFTLAMMIVEIAAGLWTQSMALLADGWHMGTHAAALTIALVAYFVARRHARNPAFSFGTGKVSVLGGFTSAIVLAGVALMMIIESGRRLVSPLEIQFNEAILVAVIGLAVNLVSAYMLHGAKSGHGHGPSEGHGHHHDHNLRAAYMHVIADALTSVLAIVALLTGKALGWVWMDPAMGIVGGLVILHWSASLLKDTGGILLDADVSSETLDQVRQAVEADQTSRVIDLHVWKVGPNERAAILHVAADAPKHSDHYRQIINSQASARHVTVEIHPAELE